MVLQKDFFVLYHEEDLSKTIATRNVCLHRR